MMVVKNSLNVAGTLINEEEKLIHGIQPEKVGKYYIYKSDLLQFRFSTL